MEIYHDRKVNRLPEISRVLGIVSIGFLIIAFPLWLHARHEAEGIYYWGVALYALVIPFLTMFLGSLVFGLAGIITASIALIMIKKKGEANRIRRIAITGLILSSLGTVIIAFLIMYLIYFG